MSGREYVSRVLPAPSGAAHIRTVLACPDCGALVLDTTVHDGWHHQVDDLEHRLSEAVADLDDAWAWTEPAYRPIEDVHLPEPGDPRLVPARPGCVCGQLEPCGPHKCSMAV